MQKIEQQNTILNLISVRQIGTQEELSELLEQKGFSVNQSRYQK